MSRRLVYLGRLIAFGLPLLLLIAADWLGIESTMNDEGALVFLALGLLLAAYGWVNRFRLVLRYPGSRLVLKGGGNVLQLMI